MYLYAPPKPKVPPLNVMQMAVPKNTTSQFADDPFLQLQGFKGAGGGGGNPDTSIHVENQITVADLRSTLTSRNDQQKASFVVLLDRCYARIRRCASVGRNECLFEVPHIVPGYPLYDIDACIMFIATHLVKSGFKVERDNDVSVDVTELVGRRFPHVLVISWASPKHHPSTFMQQLERPSSFYMSLPCSESQRRQQQQQEQLRLERQGMFDPSIAATTSPLFFPQAPSASASPSLMPGPSARQAANGYTQHTYDEEDDAPEQAPPPPSRRRGGRAASPPPSRSISDFRPNVKFQLR